MNNRYGKLSRVLGFFIIIFIIFNFVPMPNEYYITEPGIAQELSPMITVEDGYKNQGQGDFMLTAVSSHRASIWEYIYISIRNPKGVELESMAEQLPPGMDMQRYMEIMQKYMEDSKLKAQAVAFEKAGYQVIKEKRGAKIDELIASGSAAGKLKKGDTIIAIDGVKVEEDSKAVELIRKHKIGEEVEITVQRGEQMVEYQMPTVEMPNNPGQSSIGVYIYTDVSYQFPREVSFNTKNIAGSSAGGMFALEIYNQLLPQDITGDRRIAGTGTIDLNGDIGMIDGVGQKIMTAEQNKASVFLVPAENYEEAKQFASTIELVVISTFDEALEYLNID